MANLRVLDAFAGIGGFSMGLERLCGGFETVAMIEKDPFCQKILAKNFPGVPIYDDVETFPADEFTGVDVITGGFPCQPASVAGKQKGTADDRWIWPALIGIVRTVKPRWAIFENVTGLLSLEAGMVFEHCCLDMEDAGYNVQPFVIPACGKDARHRRDRVWIVGHAKHNGSSAAT